PSPVLSAYLLCRRRELARGIRSIEAERVEFAELVQEALLRRDRDEAARPGQQHWLAHLAIPVAEGELLALETGDAELRSAGVGVHAGIVGLVGARRRLGDAAHGEPGRVVALGHPAAGELGEAVLHLGRAPLLLAAMPGRRHQSLGSHHGPRVP